MRRPEQLRASGVAGTGVYLGLGQGGGLQMTSGDRSTQASRWPLRFRIELEGRAPYEVVVQDVVPIGSIARLVEGSTFPVFVDRNQPDRVLVDWPPT
jgi:hypothetical protein